MVSVQGERAEAVQKFRDTARHLIDMKGLQRDVIKDILAKLQTLAAHRKFWAEGEFPAPAPTEQQARYLIAADADHSYALYLNIMRPGKRIPPHNHTTWACIAPVEGTEQNYLFDRLDAGTEPGKASLREAGVIPVGGTTGIALMPDDIHSVQIEGTQIIRHLHMYGRALETLRERLVFDPGKGTCEIMKLSVQTRPTPN